MCYNKGKLWLQEFSCMKMLGNAGVHIDKSWVLQFQEKLDLRDSRPLTYKGRLAMPLGFKESELFFKGCQLMQEGRTNPAMQLAARDMITVEDVGAGALPACVEDAEATIQGARKFEQIGLSAAERILEACLDKVEMTSKGALFLVDLHPVVGNCFDAMVKKRNQFNMPVFYIGCFDDSLTAEWFTKCKKDQVVRLHAEGQIMIPGYKAPDMEMPSDLLEAGFHDVIDAVCFPCSELLD